MSAVFLVGVSVLLYAGARALAALWTAHDGGAPRLELLGEVVVAVPVALPVADVLVAAPKTSPPRR